MNKGFTHKSRRKTPWEEKKQRTPMQEFLHRHYSAHYEERHPLLSETGETELINSYKPDGCPHCSNETIKLYGYTRNGVQRYMCMECKQTFTPVTRTIFEGHKVSKSEWIEYILKYLGTSVSMPIRGIIETLLRLQGIG